MSTRLTPVAQLAICLFAVTAGASPPPAAPGAGSPEEPQPASESRGAFLYRLYCASCHGKEGRGDGPIADELMKSPPDLTRIAHRRRGHFPASELELIIDGRSGLEAHGSSGMPVWGLSFRQAGRLHDQEDEIALQIRQLVNHLRSIQTGPIVEPEDP